MTDDPLDKPIRELTWRRKLSASEQARLRAWLADNPGAQADYESEAALNEALDALPDAPLASNFTARVLRSLEAQQPAPAPSRNSVRNFLEALFRWLPTTAVAALTLGVALISYHHFREAHHIRIARGAAVVSEVASLPGPRALEDFDAIRAMSQSQTPPADDELIRLLQ